MEAQKQIDRSRNRGTDIHFLTIKILTLVQFHLCLPSTNENVGRFMWNNSFRPGVIRNKMNTILLIHLKAKTQYKLIVA
jgi:hypothetical protein